MNKNYLFVGIGATVAVTILALVLLSGSPAMTLNTILENKDCAALEKWESEHIYDTDLNLTSEQKNKIIKVALFCAGKALDNMFGSADETKEDPSQYEQKIKSITMLIQNRDCDGAMLWIEENGFGLDYGFSGDESGDILNYNTHCNTFAVVDRSGIDTSEAWDKYPKWDMK